MEKYTALRHTGRQIVANGVRLSGGTRMLPIDKTVVEDGFLKFCACQTLSQVSVETKAS